MWKDSAVLIYYERNTYAVNLQHTAQISQTAQLLYLLILHLIAFKNDTYL